MEIEFDPSKDAVNQEKHGLSLARAADFEIVAVIEDARFDYGEVRYRAFGYLDGFPSCLVFTVLQAGIRAISLRRAHSKEFKRYVAEIK